MNAIAELPLFADLAAGELELLRAIAQPHFAAPGEVVFSQGDAASHLHVIISGTVALRYKPHDGPPIILTHLGVGDAFGWSAVVGAATYTASSVTVSPLETVRLSGLALRKLCKTHPDVGRLVLNRLASLVSKRWKNATRQVEEILAAATPTSSDRTGTEP